MESPRGETGEGYQGGKGLCRSNVYEGKTHEVNLEVSRKRTSKRMVYESGRQKGLSPKTRGLIFK